MPLDTCPKMYDKRLAAIALQTAQGTAGTLDAAAAAFHSWDPDVVYDIATNLLPPQSSLSHLGRRISTQKGTGTFSTEIAGLGSSGVPLWFTAMQMCGMTLTSQTLSCNDAPTKVGTFGVNRDGLLRAIMDAMGTWEMTLKGGNAGMVKFDFQGIPYLAPATSEADATQLTPTLPTVVPPLVGSSTIKIGTVAYIIPEVTIAANRDVGMREHVSNSGFRSAWIKGGIYTVTVAPEASTIAVKDWGAAFLARTPLAFECIIGTVTNNIITITAPAMVLREFPGQVNRDGVLAHNLVFECQKSSAIGDELVIVAS